MGVAVKIILGVPPGGFDTINLVVTGNYSIVPVAADLTTAAEPITVANASNATAPLEYEYKG